jgi:hypothetical protein
MNVVGKLWKAEKIVEFILILEIAFPSFLSHPCKESKMYHC